MDWLDMSDLNVNAGAILLNAEGVAAVESLCGKAWLGGGSDGMLVSGVGPPLVSRFPSEFQV